MTSKCRKLSHSVAIVIVLAALTAPCAGAPDNSRELAIEAIQTEWLACARARATELDDNRSDARSIATAVAQSCRPLRVKMIETGALKNTPAGRQIVDRLVSEDINRATLFVLQERAKQK
jgi:hypothetical protein